MTSENANDRVFCETGVTLSNWTQQGGTNVLSSAAAIVGSTPGVEVNGGQLFLEGNQPITNLTINGGTVFSATSIRPTSSRQ